MRRPNARLIIALLFSLVAGFVASWWVMVFILGSEFRLYGVGNFSVVAILLALLCLIFLDSLGDIQKLIRASLIFLESQSRWIAVLLLSLASGYAVSWGIMAGLLAPELQFSSLDNLSMIAIFVACLFVISLITLKGIQKLFRRFVIFRESYTRIIIALLASLVVGVIAVGGIMAFLLLGTDFRLYSFENLATVTASGTFIENLAIVAAAVAILFVIFLVLLGAIEKLIGALFRIFPLKNVKSFLDNSSLDLGLRTFEWADAFWPGGERIALPPPRREKRRTASFSQVGNSLRVSSFVVGVVVLIAGFASLIPQVESPAPAALEISGDLAGPELAEVGGEVFRSPEAGCLACHGLGQKGLRAPDLAGIGGRAATIVPGQSAEEYIRTALVDPCAHIVEGYDCIMPQTLAQSLGTAKVTALVAFLQSQGGEITVSLSAAEAESSAAASGAGSGPGITGSTAEEIIANAAPPCATCHQLEAVGAAGAVGPDLSEVGGRLTPDEIRASILMPDAVIAEDCPGAPCTPGIMPKTYGEQLNAMQLETLVTFLSGLGGPIEESDAGD
jgi:cytochrome c2